MEGLWLSRNYEFRVMLWGQEAGKLPINGSQVWSVVLLQHTELLYVAWTGSGGCGCPPQNQLIVKAVATVGSPPAALGWGECLGTQDLSAIESLDLACPSGAVWHFGKSHDCVFQTPGYFSNPSHYSTWQQERSARAGPGVQYFQNQDEFLLSKAAEAVHNPTHGVSVEHRWGKQIPTPTRGQSDGQTLSLGDAL